MERKMTIKDFFAPTATRLGGARVRRAAMLLLMMLLTTATAWPKDYTVTYMARFIYTGVTGLYNTSLLRIDNTGLSATIAERSSAWPGNTGVCVNDEYVITFKPSSKLSIATNPGTTTATGFTMSSTKSSSTSLTASVANNSSYYIKQVKLLDQSATTGTSAATAPNSRSATVSVSNDNSILFNVIEEELNPIREQRAKWASDIDTVYDIIKDGTAKAVEKTNATLNRVRKAMRIDYFDDRSIISDWKALLG